MNPSSQEVFSQHYTHAPLPPSVTYISLLKEKSKTLCVPGIWNGSSSWNSANARCVCQLLEPLLIIWQVGYFLCVIYAFDFSLKPPKIWHRMLIRVISYIGCLYVTLCTYGSLTQMLGSKFSTFVNELCPIAYCCLHMKLLAPTKSKTFARQVTKPIHIWICPMVSIMCDWHADVCSAPRPKRMPSEKCVLALWNTAALSTSLKKTYVVDNAKISWSRPPVFITASWI